MQQTCARLGIGENILCSRYLQVMGQNSSWRGGETHLIFQQRWQTSVCLFNKGNIRHISSSFLFVMGHVQSGYVGLTDIARHVVTHWHKSLPILTSQMDPIRKKVWEQNSTDPSPLTCLPSPSPFHPPLHLNSNTNVRGLGNSKKEWAPGKAGLTLSQPKMVEFPSFMH